MIMTEFYQQHHLAITVIIINYSLGARPFTVAVPCSPSATIITNLKLRVAMEEYSVLKRLNLFLIVSYFNICIEGKRIAIILLRLQ